ncbi:MAG: hypothetical protein ACR2NN_08460 [Bryobacteraceae bacterium]
MQKSFARLLERGAFKDHHSARALSRTQLNLRRHDLDGVICRILDGKGDDHFPALLDYLTHPGFNALPGIDFSGFLPIQLGKGALF